MKPDDLANLSLFARAANREARKTPAQAVKTTAAECLFLCLFRKLRSCAMKLARRDVDDVVPETLLRLLEGLEHLKGEGKVLAFSKGVLRNVVREGWKARRKYVVVDRLPERCRIDEGLRGVETEDLLQFIESRLTDGELKLFRIWRLQAFSARAVAFELRISAHAAVCRISRLREKLKRVLADDARKDTTCR
jgi:DNA-directed RNA polymerase specialized sigma24 family protein